MAPADTALSNVSSSNFVTSYSVRHESGKCSPWAAFESLGLLAIFISRCAFDAAQFPGSIGSMVDAIVPAAKAVYGRPGDFVDNAVRESARRTAAKIATESVIVAHLIKANKVSVLAARYDLDDGRVEFLT
jgi:hypothetical protein